MLLFISSIDILPTTVLSSISSKYSSNFKRFSSGFMSKILSSNGLKIAKFSQHVTRDSITYRFCKVILPFGGFSRSMITFVFIPSPCTLHQHFLLKCEPYDPTKQILTSVIAEYATCVLICPQNLWGMEISLVSASLGIYRPALQYSPGGGVCRSPAPPLRKLEASSTSQPDFRSYSNPQNHWGLELRLV